jgi:protein phosphatase
VASLAAVEKFKDLYGKKAPDESLPDFYLKAIDILDEFVYHLTNKMGERGGTTIVAAIIEQDQLFWLSAGDSRLYILRGNEFVQATRDHNYSLRLQQQLESGEIDKKKFEKESNRGGALISNKGMGGIKEMDISNEPFKLKHGDTILLTTDGLYKALSDDEIHQCLRLASINEALDTLFHRATETATKAQDNTTCVIIRYDGEGETK